MTECVAVSQACESLSSSAACFTGAMDDERQDGGASVMFTYSPSRVRPGQVASQEPL